MGIEQPTADPRVWTQITDGLPPVGERVLGYHPSFGIHFVLRSYLPPHQFIWDDDSTVTENDEHVATHWMSLPVHPCP